VSVARAGECGEKGAEGCENKGLCRVHDDVNESVECEAKPLQRLVGFDPIQAHDLMKQERVTRVAGDGK
jgi:hypothetical protein